MSRCIIHGCVWCTCRPRHFDVAAVRAAAKARYEKCLEEYAATPEGKAEAERVRKVLLEAVAEWRAKNPPRSA